MSADVIDIYVRVCESFGPGPSRFCSALLALEAVPIKIPVNVNALATEMFMTNNNRERNATFLKATTCNVKHVISR